MQRLFKHLWSNVSCILILSELKSIIYSKKRHVLVRTLWLVASKFDVHDLTVDEATLTEIKPYSSKSTKKLINFRSFFL
jgi:hypothetical protein